MVELTNTELYILVSLERKQVFTMNELSLFCDIDKTTCYKAVNVLEKLKFLIKIDSSPLKYAVNYNRINEIN